MGDDIATAGSEAQRPTAEGLLAGVHARVCRSGPPALNRLWEGLRTRFTQEWAAYCRARGVEEAPDWEDFPLSRPAALARLLEAMALTYTGDAAAAPRPTPAPRTREAPRPNAGPRPRTAAERGGKG